VPRKISIRDSNGGYIYSKLRKKYISILLGVNAIGEIIDLADDKLESLLDIDRYFHGSNP
jgi:hypothetical protein